MFRNNKLQATEFFFNFGKKKQSGNAVEHKPQKSNRQKWNINKIPKF